MAKTKLVELDEEELEILRKAREERIKNLEQELLAEKSRLAKLKGSERELVLSHANELLLPRDYDKTWSLPKKIEYALKRIGRCITAREIYNEVTLIEPNKADKPGSNKLYTDISSCVGSYSKNDKMFRRYRAGENDQYYVGLIEWFDGDKPKPEYR